MKKLLVISQDEKYDKEKNHDLFLESLNFAKTLAAKPNFYYAQLARFKYGENGLLRNMIKKYIDSVEINNQANILFDSSDNIEPFETTFPKKTRTEYYRDIFTSSNGISVSSIRDKKIPIDYSTKLNSLYCFNNSTDFICNNFNYVILHHGGPDLVYYFSMLNTALNNNSYEPMNLKNVFLINKNHIFDNLIEQYNLFTKLGLSQNAINPNIQICNSLNECLNNLNKDSVYHPKSKNSTGFSITD